MASGLASEIPTGGFNFGNFQRNLKLDYQGVSPPKAVKTGTTIVGLIFANGVVLGADTRATAGNVVADKNCSKIHRLAPRMYCCGAGTAADTEMTTRNIESQLELLRLNMGREVPVCVANRLLQQMLFRYQGYVSAALVLGGVDKSGPHIYCIYPHGSTDKIPYATMGSGSLAAMSVFENGWSPEMDETTAVKLVRDAICAGIENDLGSGSNVDVTIIRKNEKTPKIMRPYDEIGIRGQRHGNYTYKKGTTKVLQVETIKLEVEEEEVVQRMDTGED